MKLYPGNFSAFGNYLETQNIKFVRMWMKNSPNKKVIFVSNWITSIHDSARNLRKLLDHKINKTVRLKSNQLLCLIFSERYIKWLKKCNFDRTFEIDFIILLDISELSISRELHNNNKQNRLNIQGN